MNQLVTEARALSEGVTDGPWEPLLSIGKKYWIKTPSYGMRDFYCLTGDLDREADAALIARSRTLLPEMAEEIERLQAELDAANDLVSRAAVWLELHKSEGIEDVLREFARHLAAMKEDAHESHT
jgi:hypothetical protein